MRKLYLQIYVTLVVVLLAFVLLAGVFWRELAERAGYRQFAVFASEVAEAMLPTKGEPPAVQEAALQRWAGRVRMSLYTTDGKFIAAAGEPLPLEDREQRWQGRGHAWTLQLSDGRWLVGKRVRPPRAPPVWGFVLFLLGLALAVAVGAYPVVRRVTRRLERLEHGVEALGAGDLKARVQVEGKDEIARLAARFNDSAARIESLVGANKALLDSNKALLANASHELRSPLARIRMALESPGVDEGARGAVAQDVAELDQLIDEILLASRLDAQSDRAPLEEVDLLALAAEEAARVDASAEGEPVVVRGEPKLLRRVVRNLLENARRHAPGEAPEVRVRREEGHAVLEVLDRGPGIAEAERERIFEPFYRPAGARESAGGHGLGLALVRQIATRHGGTAACAARDGGGSVFFVRLPGS